MRIVYSSSLIIIYIFKVLNCTFPGYEEGIVIYIVFPICSITTFPKTITKFRLAFSGFIWRLRSLWYFFFEKIEYTHKLHLQNFFIIISQLQKYYNKSR